MKIVFAASLLLLESVRQVWSQKVGLHAAEAERGDLGGPGDGRAAATDFGFTALFP